MKKIITVIVDTEDWNDPADKRTLNLIHQDCIAKIFDDEDNKKIGTVSGVVGGGVRIHIDNEQTDFVINIHPGDLWNAAVKLAGRKDLFYSKQKTDKQHDH